MNEHFNHTVKERPTEKNFTQLGQSQWESLIQDIGDNSKNAVHSSKQKNQEKHSNNGINFFKLLMFWTQFLRWVELLDELKQHVQGRLTWSDFKLMI